MRSTSSKSLAEERPGGGAALKRQKSAELAEAAAPPEGLRVRTAAGSALVSLSPQECAGMPVKMLRQRVFEAVSHAGNVKLFLATRELKDSEKLDDFVRAGEVQEVLMVASLVPRLDPDKPPIEQLEVLKGMIMSDSVEYQLDGVTHVRKLLSVELDPPIQQIIDLDIVPCLVQLASEPDDTTPAVQNEALWVLINIASGTSEQTQVVVAAGTLPAVTSILEKPPNDEVLESAIWALGNIAGDSPNNRDMAHDAGVMTPLLQVLERDPPVTTALLRNGVWALSNLCRGKPSPDVEKVVPAVPVLARLLNQEDLDPEAQADAAWATSYITDGPNERIQLVIDAGLCPRMVELVTLATPSARDPALRTVGNIVTGNDAQTQSALDAGLLPALVGMLGDDKTKIRKEACWTFSNIFAGTREHIQAALDSGAVPGLIEHVGGADSAVQKEAAWCFANASSGGSPEQIRALVDGGSLEAMAAVLHGTAFVDWRVQVIVLEFLQNVARVEDPSATPGADADQVRALYADRMRAALPLDAIQTLLRTGAEEVESKAAQLKDKLYPDGDEDDVDVEAPASAVLQGPAASDL